MLCICVFVCVLKVQIYKGTRVAHQVYASLLNSGQLENVTCRLCKSYVGITQQIFAHHSIEYSMLIDFWSTSVEISIKQLTNWLSLANNWLWICCPGHSPTTHTHILGQTHTCTHIHTHIYIAVASKWWRKYFVLCYWYILKFWKLTGQRHIASCCLKH